MNMARDKKVRHQGRIAFARELLFEFGIPRHEDEKFHIFEIEPTALERVPELFSKLKQIADEPIRKV